MTRILDSGILQMKIQLNPSSDLSMDKMVSQCCWYCRFDSSCSAVSNRSWFCSEMLFCINALPGGNNASLEKRFEAGLSTTIHWFV